MQDATRMEERRWAREMWATTLAVVRVSAAAGAWVAVSGCACDAILIAADAGTPPSADAGVTDAYPNGMTDGVDLCCAEGAGLDCCTAERGRLGYESLPDGGILTHGARSDGSTLANCFVYGGVYRACVPRGESREARVICSLCCDGLTSAPSMVVAADGTCMQVDPFSTFLCLPCGDGRCDADENRCSCPADCG